jgi:hypothetical protein
MRKKNYRSADTKINRQKNSKQNLSKLNKNIIRTTYCEHVGFILGMHDNVINHVNRFLTKMPR